MKGNIFVLALSMFTLNNSAQDTFSIIAVDSVTHEVGSAGASCIGSSVSNPDGVMIISGIIPGRGGVNAQASVCIPHYNLQNAMTWMSQGMSPQQILNSLLANDACTYGDSSNRQYGIVDFDSLGKVRSAGYSGVNCLNYKNHITGVNYSIQGNILLGQNVLDSMESGFLKASGDLACKLMAALQGAKIPGADTRCLQYNKSSISSYLRVAKPNNSQGAYYLELIVPNTPNTIDPIDSLQLIFDSMHNCPVAALKNKSAENFELSIFPNPSNSAITLMTRSMNYKKYEVLIFDVLGNLIFQKTILNTTDKPETLNFNLSNGVYFLQLICSDFISVQKIIIQ